MQSVSYSNTVADCACACAFWRPLFGCFRAMDPAPSTAVPPSTAQGIAWSDRNASGGQERLAEGRSADASSSTTVSFVSPLVDVGAEGARFPGKRRSFVVWTPLWVGLLMNAAAGLAPVYSIYATVCGSGNACRDRGITSMPCCSADLEVLTVCVRLQLYSQQVQHTCALNNGTIPMGAYTLAQSGNPLLVVGTWLYGNVALFSVVGHAGWRALWYHAFDAGIYVTLHQPRPLHRLLLVFAMVLMVYTITVAYFTAAVSPRAAITVVAMQAVMFVMFYLNKVDNVSRTLSSVHELASPYFWEDGVDRHRQVGHFLASAVHATDVQLLGAVHLVRAEETEKLKESGSARCASAKWRFSMTSVKEKLRLIKEGTLQVPDSADPAKSCSTWVFFRTSSAEALSHSEDPMTQRFGRALSQISSFLWAAITLMQLALTLLLGKCVQDAG